ncbi:hypothetical protein, unlikely [Trypanosoma brucei gambiense DAL972]|uniref:Uncharacterized protein n=1 Tax=Trypanosoma brucei gambiense (strain MHOM/CI/86/DAL972) TaxID=679716 RepID=D0A0F6_TRYB9|nr:hypothetical protein, unlikely [Trypanosoma brucei gambiense DAL972]CBH16714.1 hypothetical protein, unlikely [Trypanosoma brucei gambiense DAL972]|eukprot:XP_011778978.1 hypothetical protein, unlikely [Trypanosoma brucei gambiense DAL972]
MFICSNFDDLLYQVERFDCAAEGGGVQCAARTCNREFCCLFVITILFPPSPPQQMIPPTLFRVLLLLLRLRPLVKGIVSCFYFYFSHAVISLAHTHMHIYVYIVFFYIFIPLATLNST